MENLVWYILLWVGEERYQLLIGGLTTLERSCPSLSLKGKVIHHAIVQIIKLFQQFNSLNCLFAAQGTRLFGLARAYCTS